MSTPDTPSPAPHHAHPDGSVRVPPRALTIAGSDSGGGAGIQADLKTMWACRVHGMSVVTAVTAQNSLGVQGAWELPAAAVRQQFRSVVDDIGVQAVKTGMLASPVLVETVADLVAELSAKARVPVVVDPVGVSKHGDPLLAADAMELLRTRLLPTATVVTPNLPEATELTGVRVAGEADMQQAAAALLTYGPRWVLLKGGHLPGPPGGATGPEGADRGQNGGADAVDLLTDGREEHWLRAPRQRNRHTHGTGCTLAAALAAGLARGRTVLQAARAAKEYVTAAIAAGYPLGAGIGPVGPAGRAPAPVSRPQSPPCGC